jgi:drug/metabolite transporter (DMT)-like permease
MSPKIVTLVFLAFVTVAALVESFADALFEKWSLVGKGYLLVAGLVIYAVSSAFWAYSLKYQTLSKGIVMFNVVNILLGVLIGVLYFKEVLTGTNIAGIALGIASVILLSI